MDRRQVISSTNRNVIMPLPQNEVLCLIDLLLVINHLVGGLLHTRVHKDREVWSALAERLARIFLCQEIISMHFLGKFWFLSAQSWEELWGFSVQLLILRDTFADIHYLLKGNRDGRDWEILLDMPSHVFDVLFWIAFLSSHCNSPHSNFASWLLPMWGLYQTMHSEWNSNS